MKEFGILSQPFISSMDIMFLSVAGWTTQDLENLPPDMIRSLIASELKKKETVDKFRRITGLHKNKSLDMALKLQENSLPA